MGLGFAGGGFAAYLLYVVTAVALLLALRATGLRLAVRSGRASVRGRR
ncbi:hypothetical protein HFP15_06540 [Amycolatopsis sp. K13G38]|uniref:Heme exporter protein D n=1 Tax=Amycolatopsis acididurans TaxID=2724524 RepID=A0ABX1IYK5_9PSEU|nr:hypothetical protein [Amycolatopsis acididurans]NKQ52534.1 hypothetical protein [Amycolatopsis acididurans]